jgi:hypothetical protein
MKRNILTALLAVLLITDAFADLEESNENISSEKTEESAKDDTSKTDSPESSAETSGSNSSAAEDYETYISTLNEQQRKYLKESWSKHKKAREANGVLFIEYESAKPKSRGHIFFFPSWTTTHQMLKLAETGSSNGYDCFVFLPIPEISEHLPNSENNDEITSVKSAFLNYVKASVDTIGTHDKTNLILCAGETLSWVLSGIEESLIFNPNGLIAYNATYRDLESNSYVATQLSTYKGFFADIITTDSNSYLNDAVEKRTFMLKKQGRKPSSFKVIKCDDTDELIKSFGAYVRKTRFQSSRIVK